MYRNGLTLKKVERRNKKNQDQRLKFQKVNLKSEAFKKEQVNQVLLIQQQIPYPYLSSSYQKVCFLQNVNKKCKK